MLVCVILCLRKGSERKKMLIQRSTIRLQKLIFQSLYQHCLGTQHPHAGYIAVKDKGIVTMFSNDLSGVPIKPVLLGMDAEAPKLVHGLVDISRWFGNMSVHSTIFAVPAILRPMTFHECH